MRQVIARLRELGAGSVSETAGEVETVEFKLPEALEAG